MFLFLFDRFSVAILSAHNIQIKPVTNCGTLQVPLQLSRLSVLCGPNHTLMNFKETDS